MIVYCTMAYANELATRLRGRYSVRMVGIPCRGNAMVPKAIAVRIDKKGR